MKTYYRDASTQFLQSAASASLSTSYDFQVLYSCCTSYSNRLMAYIELEIIYGRVSGYCGSMR